MLLIRAASPNLIVSKSAKAVSSPQVSNSNISTMENIAIVTYNRNRYVVRKTNDERVQLNVSRKNLHKPALQVFICTNKDIHVPVQSRASQHGFNLELSG